MWCPFVWSAGGVCGSMPHTKMAAENRKNVARKCNHNCKCLPY